MVTYVQGLLAVSAVFLILERLRPRYRTQRILRPGILTDLAYFVLNGHFLGVGLALLSAPLLREVQGAIAAAEAGGWWSSSVASTWPWALQFLVAFLVIDFLQWSIHNLLHRVPFLWKFHKVHHSIRHMDFWGSLRFHWAEILVYRTLLYLPGVWFGFSESVLFTLALVSTAIGHWNHANLDVDIGRLGKVLNHPRMHIWHHHNDPGHPVLVNFGINLSLWDYLFGTAHVPEHPPRTLGFPDLDTYPDHFVSQVVYPLRIPGRARPSAGPGNPKHPNTRGQREESGDPPPP